LNFASISLRAAIVFAFCLAVCPRSPGAAPASPEQRLTPLQVQTIDDLLAPLRPEFQADLTFEVLDRSGNSFSRKQKQQLIRRVFENSVKAKYPYPTIDASHTQLGLANQIGVNLRWTRMDTLDIQARAVEHALAVSPKFAQELFESISIRTPHGYSCETRSIANVSAYYKTVGLLMRDDRLSSLAYNESSTIYLATLAKTMNAPVEIVPMANLLSDKQLPVKDLGPALAGFAGSLSSLTATDREMAVIEDSGQLTQAIESLAEVFKASGASESVLLQAYKDFLIRSLSAEQCSDYSIDRKQVVKRFNGLAAQRLGVGSTTFSLLTEDQLRPLKRTDPVPEPLLPVAYTVMPQIKRMLDIKKANLIHEHSSGEPGTEQPDDADMQAVLDYVVSSDSYSPGCPLCDFESRMTTVIMLLSYLPTGDALNRTVDLGINSLLANSSMEEEEPEEWIKLMRDFLNISRTPDAKGRSLIDDALKQNVVIVLGPSPAAKEVKFQLRQSNDSIIRAYYTIERVLPIPFQTSNRF